MRGGRFVVLLGLLLLSACSSASPKPDASALPEGWRWESYGNVEVGVPSSWGWGNGSQRLGQWCVQKPDGKPVVGRPGVSSAAGCLADPAGPDPSSLIKNTG
ncbi:hypothetical protein BH09ACT10_BH09ACT10_23380 [soil metagenome]